MKRFSALPTIALASLCLAIVLVPGAAEAAIHAVHSPPLVGLGQSLPAAKSGQAYLWTLKAEGGTPPYHCVAKKLGVGTIALTAACKISGTAPVVQSMSVTGPFRFKVQDSSSPKKTSEFPSMNFTVLGPTTVAPAAPSGFQLVGSFVGNAANGWEAAANPTVQNPTSIDIRVIGKGKFTTSVYMSCRVGSAYPEVDKTFGGAGLFPLSVPAGSSSCGVDVQSNREDESLATFTMQIYAQTGAAPTPKPPPTPTVTDAVTPATVALGSAGGCAGGNLTTTIQIASAPNVSWTIKEDPNSFNPGQVVSGSGSGSGPFTVTIHVPPQTPTFACINTVSMNETTLVDVTFSNSSILGVTVHWTYTFVE